MSDSAIAAIVQHYYKGWEPPVDRGHEWTPCLCPDHDEDRPSCAVNYRDGAIRCHACPFKGDVISIVMKKEGLPYAKALSFAESILASCDIELPRESTRQSGRRSFGGPGPAEHGRKSVPTGLRRRTSFGS